MCVAVSTEPMSVLPDRVTGLAARASRTTVVTPAAGVCRLVDDCSGARDYDFPHRIVEGGHSGDSAVALFSVRYREGQNILQSELPANAQAYGSYLDQRNVRPATRDSRKLISRIIM